MTNDKRDARRPSMFKDDHDRMQLIFNVEAYYEDFDPLYIPSMLKNIKEIVFPARYIVCYVCEGRGSYVNPDIDRQGLDPSEMDEEFAESYYEGSFDITCRYCEGRRVVLEIVSDHPDVNPQLLKLVIEEQEEQAKLEREHMAEVQAEQRALGYG